MPGHLLHGLYRLNEPPVSVIELAGQASELEELEFMDELPLDPKTKHIALCMDKVTYINSKGCEELIRLHHAIRKHGYKLFIINPSDKVARVMEMIGCYGILHIVDSLADALREAEEANEK